MDDPGDLQQTLAPVGSRADGSAGAWPAIGRRAARGATPARVHLIAVAGQGQAGRQARMRLGQKARR